MVDALVLTREGDDLRRLLRPVRPASGCSSASRTPTWTWAEAGALRDLPCVRHSLRAWRAIIADPSLARWP